jgi:hypothetical protein
MTLPKTHIEGTSSRPPYLRVEQVGKQKRKPHFPDEPTQILESGKEASHA